MTLSDSVYRELFHSARLGLEVCRLDNAKRLIVNQAYANIFGRTIEETLTRTFSDDTPRVYFEKDVDGLSPEERQIARLEEQGDYGPYEKHYIRADGRVVPVRLRGTKATVDGVDYIWSAVDEIVEPAYEPLLKNSPIGIALNTMGGDEKTSGRFIQVNQAFADIVGHSIDDLKQMTYWNITPKDYVEGEAEQLARLRGEGVYGPYVKKYIHKDGYTVTVRLQGMVVNVRGVDHIWSVVEDLCASQSNSIFLKSQIAFAINTLGNAADRSGGEFVQMSDEFANMLGYTRSELMCKTYWSITPVEFEAEEAEQLEKLEKTGRYGPYNKKYKKKDGNHIGVILQGMMVRLGAKDYIWSWAQEGGMFTDYLEDGMASKTLKEPEPPLSVSPIHPFSPPVL